jgi:hypothetical protein
MIKGLEVKGYGKLFPSQITARWIVKRRKYFTGIAPVCETRKKKLKCAYSD